MVPLLEQELGSLDVTVQPDDSTDVDDEMELKKRLEDSRKCVPRFLFRTFSNLFGGPNQALNSLASITPLAFLSGNNLPASIYDIEDLKGMINCHLGEGTYRQTEFSSWAASIEVADYYLQRGVYGQDTACMAILDTKLATDIAIYPVRTLHREGLTYFRSDDEYLAHGPIGGPGYYCARYEDLIAQGLLRFLLPIPVDISLKNPEPIEYDEALDAKNVAVTFTRGNERCPELITIVTAALLSLRCRLWDKGQQFMIADLEKIMECLQRPPYPTKVPESLKDEDFIVADSLYTDKYPELKRMVYLLRALIDRSLKEEEGTEQATSLC